MMPFVKLSWNNEEIRRAVEPQLKRISQVCYDTEYEMVRRGLRKANVYHMFPHSFDKQIEKITRDGLIFLPSQRSQTYNGFSHRHYPVKQLDMNSMVYGIVAKDVETAQKFIDAERKHDNFTQGELLGYPKCCTEKFDVWWLKDKILDPCFEPAVNTPGAVLKDDTVTVKGNPCLNVMLRYFNVKIIPWFPCSYKCEESAKRAETWLSVIDDLDNGVGALLKSFLSQPLKWSLVNGIIYIETLTFKGIVNGYACNNVKNVIWEVK